MLYYIILVTGSAGCQENHDDFGPLKNFTAFRANDYGFTRMKAVNHTHLYFEQVSDDKVIIPVYKINFFGNYYFLFYDFKDGKIIDSIWIIKNKHGAY